VGSKWQDKQAEGNRRQHAGGFAPSLEEVKSAGRKIIDPNEPWDARSNGFLGLRKHTEIGRRLAMSMCWRLLSGVAIRLTGSG
jgi:hypothetical protein